MLRPLRYLVWITLGHFDEINLPRFFFFFFEQKKSFNFTAQHLMIFIFELLVGIIAIIITSLYFTLKFGFGNLWYYYIFSTTIFINYCNSFFLPQ